MVSVTGKSIVPINQVVLSKFLNGLVPSDKVPEFNVKLDGREKVKSVYVKLEGTVLTIYSGAIKNCFYDGETKIFNCKSESSLILLFILYGIKKFNQYSENVFEVKTTKAGISGILADTVFTTTMNQLSIFENKYLELYPDGYSNVVPEPLKEVSVKKIDSIVKSDIDNIVVDENKVSAVRKSVDSENKGVPLENTPKIEVPAGLDLTGV